MSKVLCVLYDDPVEGFPKSYAREGIPRIERYHDGQTTPTPSHVATAMELWSGATANLIASFEAADRYVCDLEIHGREGVLALPDANAFGGPLRLRRNRGDWEEVPYHSRGAREARGIGLQDLVDAVEERRAPRASGRLAAHVVDVARSVLQAAAERRTVEVASRAERPDPLPVLRPA